jgi:Family of unknown function (DUF5631)/Family of unknown function (DUF5632)
VAGFGRRSTRRRLRRGSRKDRPLPPYQSGTDCTAWVLDGVWPADLAQITPENTAVADYLRRDLLRIAEQANDRIQAIAAAGLDPQLRTAEESRIINVGRAFAVLRVESAVRHLRREPLGFRPDFSAIDAPARSVTPEPEVPPVAEPGEPPEPEIPPAAEPEATKPATPDEPEILPPTKPAKHAKPEPKEFGWSYPDGTETPEPKPEIVDVTPAPTEPAELVSRDERLRRLLRHVARQEPGLRWGLGELEDGSTLLITDLAHGWIPPGINLPAGVELLAPGRRTDSLASWLTDAVAAVTYTPGERLGGTPQSDERPATSTTPRLLAMPDDLGEQLAAATQGRTGLPRLTHALASAAAASRTVPEAEVDVLRVHMDTARYQLLGNYPQIDNALLLNCQLLAATEAMATGDPVAANYHLSWFRALNGVPQPGQVSGWTPRN